MNLIDGNDLMFKIAKTIDYCEKNNRLRDLNMLFEFCNLIEQCPTIDPKQFGNSPTMKHILKIAEKIEQERDAAIKDIPHKCRSCANSFLNSGIECNQAHYIGNNPNCVSWEWRGKKRRASNETD